jgi:uncharacterized repeat protein (TIGR01451 family)
MKKFNTNSIIALTILIFSLVLGFTRPIIAQAATAPLLGSTSTFGIVSDTFTNSNTPPQTIINGDVCFTTGPTTVPLSLSSAAIVPCSPTTGIDQGAALTDINGQACTSLGVGAVALDSVVVGANPPGTFPPGCYTSGGAMNVTLGSTVTLNGAGAYIFRPGGALNTGDNSNIALTNGASVCDVFWAPVGFTTIGANASLSTTPTFVGNILDAAGITLGHFANLSGRALAFGGTVTTDANTLTVPTCTVPPLPATIDVVKTVVNDNGRTKVVSDFPLFVNGTPVISGVTTVFPVGAYTITETADPNYIQTFSGDCDATGHLSIAPGDVKVCIITNDDIPLPIPAAPASGGGGLLTAPIPPLIDVVKVPTPLALPNGPGPVTYTYTLRNVGTVPVTNLTMVGDTCSPITLISGDTNNNSILDLNEVWIYSCITNLSATHTNTVTATGFANGISAVDVASATVVVGVPGLPNTGFVVPPLIHVTKIPNPLALPIGGGIVTYVERVTNPGIVPLSNVRINDDRCAPVTLISGDTNGNGMLDTNEAWIYTCRVNLAKTTTNTVIVEGSANGLTARDFAIATVVVAIPRLPNTGIPGLPNTGYGPEGTTPSIIVLSGILLFLSTSLVVFLKKRAG